MVETTTEVEEEETKIATTDVHINAEEEAKKATAREKAWKELIT